MFPWQVNQNPLLWVVLASLSLFVRKSHRWIFQILPCNRSIAINVFLKKFNFNDAQSFVRALRDSKSDLNAECCRMLLKILPTPDEVRTQFFTRLDFDRIIDLDPTSPWSSPRTMGFAWRIHRCTLVDFLLWISCSIENFDPWIFRNLWWLRTKVPQSNHNHWFSTNESFD